MMPGHEDIEELKKLFEEISADSWNVYDPLYWCFYFLDREKWKLETLFAYAKNNDFSLEGFSILDEKIWSMCLTKYDVLTPEELFKINKRFLELSQICDIEMYEGWEVLQKKI